MVINQSQHPEDIDFQRYGLILKRHRLPATVVWCSAVLLAGLLALSQKQIHQAYGKIRLSRENATSALVNEAGDKIGKLDSLSQQNTPLDTEAEVIRSFPVVDRTIKELNLTHKDSAEPLEYSDFLKNLSVAGIPGTDILLVSYRSADPEEAKSIVAQLMETYLSTNVAFNRAQASSAREFISLQLPRIESSLKQSEAVLRDFKEKNQVVDLEAESEFIVSQLGQVDSQIDQAQTALDKVTAQVDELQNKVGLSSEEALALSKLNDSVAVQQVYVKLKEVEEELASESRRFGEQSPAIASLERERADLSALLQERVNDTLGSQVKISSQVLETGDIQKSLIEALVEYETERRGLLQELQSLAQIKDNYQKRASIIPELQQQQGDLERQLEANQASYETLLNNLQATRIVENQNVGNAQVISPAIVSPDPVSTSRKLILAAGIVTGGILYVVTAFILELKDPSLKSTKDIRGFFPYTLLGTIPRYRKKILPQLASEAAIPRVIAVTAPNSMIGQAYKMLQAKLRFISPNQKLHSITVTSSVSKEGKSTVSANLAAAIAQLGNRVLLVDADLHHPQQHHLWNLANGSGLSELIMNQVQHTQVANSVMPNLDIISSGSVPPNSLALLGSKRMNALIDAWHQQYDFVIFDTPPMLILPDALTLGQKTDGILFVARLGVIDPSSAIATQELLEQSNQNVLGLVINGAENESDHHFHAAENYFRENSNSETFKINRARS